MTGNVGGVDLSDFASPPRPTQLSAAAAEVPRGGLGRLTEVADEDNIPGAKAIGHNGNGHASSSALPVKKSHHSNKTPTTPTSKAPKKSSTGSSAKSTTPGATTPSAKTPNSSKNGGRKLADTKPLSYPNLLITRTGDTPATNAMGSSGHPSNTATPTTPAAPDTISVNSVNSTGSGSVASKSSRHHHHLHRQGSAEMNGKDGKCSVM